MPPRSTPTPPWTPSRRRFAVEAHLGGLFEATSETIAPLREPSPMADHYQSHSPRTTRRLSTTPQERLDLQERPPEARGEGRLVRRTADFLASKTDPDSSPMKRRESKGSHLGYYAHYVVDGGKARVILNALVTPFEVPRTPRCSTCSGGAASGGSSARGRSPATPPTAPRRTSPPSSAPASAPTCRYRGGQGRPFFSKEEFAYDAEGDLYRCPAGETLLSAHEQQGPHAHRLQGDGGYVRSVRSETQMHRNKTGRQVLRYFDEAYVDRVRAYRGTFPYEKALRKRRVWVEPLFAEAKDCHGMRRFRLRRLEKVNAEALLIAAGQNIKRLLTFGYRRPRRTAQAAALRPPRRPPSTCRPHWHGGPFGSTRESPSNVLQQPGKLRASANRRVAYVSRDDRMAVKSL